VTPQLQLTKAHAYGNDFLLIDERTPLLDGPQSEHSPDLVRRLCARHTGVGADGVVLFGLHELGATMRLFNADGSPSELSGNGLRCLAALVARRRGLALASVVKVDTSAGTKDLELLAVEGLRYTFRTALGPPADVRQVHIPVLDESLTASVLSVGNPQCVVLGPLPDRPRFQRLGPALSTHALFPAGTNVEFAHVEAHDRIRILIW
jgi:diaminopimelate epimerase